jgi:N-carbamoyl-L-amino-acid hydrolase
MNIGVHVDRISGELEQLAKFSDAEPPGVTRIVFTPADLRAREWLKEKFRSAGLDVREDPVGNTFARWHGAEPDLPAIGTGSHVDAIPNSGRFDGTVGVVGGLEAIRALQNAGYRPRKSIELVLFTSEEPTRFGLGCLGSRLLAGVLSPEAAGKLRDSGGSTLEEVRSAAGLHGALKDVKLPERYYDAFIELHIEQGPTLEREGIQLGVVTDIAAPASLRIIVEGQGGHAGAVLMPQRRDALTAAAQLILAVESAALSTGVIDTVATTGICDVFPGAVNSVPSRVKLDIDVRDVEQERRNVVLSLIEQASQTIAQKRAVSVRSELLNADAPAKCARFIIDALVQTCAAQSCTHRTMISRAYHDSLFMARIAPVGMLFIPCREGVSHRPDEYASPEGIADGARVLAHALAQLAA